MSRNIWFIYFLFFYFRAVFATDVSNDTELNNAIQNAGVTTITFTGDIQPVSILFPVGTNTSFTNRSDNILIDGAGNTLAPSTTDVRGFAIGGNPSGGNTGTITIQDLTIANTQAKGGNASVGGGGGAGLGGGLFVNESAIVVAKDLQFVNCAAKGGNSELSTDFIGGGGGGGLGGSSGSPVNNSALGGGGGGGFSSSGGAVVTKGGSGGGGVQGAGGLSNGTGGSGGGGLTSSNNGDSSSDAAGGDGGGDNGGSGGAIPTDPVWTGLAGSAGGGGSGGGGGSAGVENDVATTGGDGGDGGSGGGGGGGGCADSGDLFSEEGGNGGDGGYGSGGGGGGSRGYADSESGSGGNGSDFGGGGGSAVGLLSAYGDVAASAGNGGFGGGGGASGGATIGTTGGNGGSGGFGGGGGSTGKLQDETATAGTPGSGGYAAGDGSAGDADQIPAGGGGAALGGAVFVRNGGTLTIQLTNSYSGSLFSGSSLTAGTGSNNGEAHGTDIFLMSGGNLTFDLETDLTLDNAIDSDQGDGGGSNGTLTKSGSAKLTLAANNTFDGNFNINAGTVAISADSCLGAGNTAITLNGGKLQSTSTFSTARNFALGASGGTFNVDSGTTLTVSGNITGNGSLTITGSGTLNLNGTNSFSGKAIFQSGTKNIASSSDVYGTGGFELDDEVFNITDDVTLAKDCTLASGGGTFTVAAGKAFQISGTLDGAGTLTKNGEGTLTLSGNSPDYTQAVSNNAGTLLVTGTLGCPITVASSGILKGTGQVGTTTNSGTVEPGASIGTLTISGDFTQDSSGTLTIEVGATEADKLIVTGTASLDGTLSLVEVGDSPSKDTTYTIIEAGSIIGTFSTVTSTLSLQHELTYTSTEVILSFTGVDTTLLSGNARAIGDYLFCSSSPSTNSDLNSVVSLLEALSINDLTTALNTLSPSRMGALPLVNARTAGDVARSAKPRLTPNTQPEWWLYATPLYNYYGQSGINDQYGFDANNGGVVIGGEYVGIDHLQAGLFAGYTYTKLNWRSNAGDAKLASGYLTPYVGYCTPKWGILIGPMGILNHYNVDRHIYFSTVDRFATNDHWGGGIGAHIRWQATLPVGPQTDPRFTIDPEVSCDYINLWEENYTESNADSLNIEMPAQFTSYISPTALLSFGLPISSSERLDATAHIGGGYSGFYILSHYTTTAHFFRQTTCQSDFTTTSYATNYHQAMGRVALVLDNQDGAAANIAYEMTAGNGAINHSAQVRLEWRF